MGRSLHLVLFGGAVVLAAALSCKTFDLPNETCDPSGLDAKPMVDSEPIEKNCSRCLEDHCCDKVGVCANKTGCSDLVHQAHACVLSAGRAGAGMEIECTKNLPTPSEARDAYLCMREQCGTQCALPVCKVDPAAALFRNPDCDKCIAGSCCAELDRCYGSRACKLSIECVGRECGPELRKSFNDAYLRGGTTMRPVLPDGAPPDFCTEPGASMFDAPACVRNCLCAFKDHDEGLAPTEVELQPLTLARRVYECAGLAKCGDVCEAKLEGGTL